ncbi:MAG TPA: hypothetical protein VGN12_06940 [Pirellulales bacterium]|jgi:hypothetical protein
MTTTLEIDLANILSQKYPRGFHAPADIEIGTFLEFADDDWSYQLNVEDLLATKQLIGIIWNVRLILDERPDLTNDQAWTVLQACQSHFEQVTDPIRGTVRAVADELFPRSQGKVAVRALLTQIEQRLEAFSDHKRIDAAAYDAIASTLEGIAKILGGQ